MQIVSTPRKIDLPDHILLDETKKNLNSIKEMAESTMIERVFCGNKFSAFLTNTGEFWAAGNCANAGKVAIAKGSGHNIRTRVEKSEQS